MAGKYCAGCGERKRITWAEWFCTQRCAAVSYLAEVQGGDTGYCPDCGDGADHGYCPADE